MKCLGQGKFEFQLGPLKIVRSATVAAITDDVLLGADILLKDAAGPADIILSEERMSLLGKSIPLLLFGVPGKVRKAYAADHFVIPGMSEAVIDVYVDRDSRESNDKNVVIEPIPQLAEKAQVTMAACLVNVADNATVQVRVLNPLKHDASIKQDTVLGYAECISLEPQTLLRNEEGDSKNFDSVRNIVLPDRVVLSPASDTVRQADDYVKESQKLSTIPDHLKALYEETIQDKTDFETEAIVELLTKHQGVFSTGPHDLGLTHLAEHAIDTGDAAPIKQAPRRTPIAFEGEDQKALENLQKQGAIRPSTSPWASPIVLVRKKDGSVRPCVDYRRLNAVTKKDAFPIPRMEDCLDAVAGAVYFSTVDITSAYHQVPVKAEDIQKTAFVTKYGLYEFITMPFGLSNSPGTFQRVMEMALRGLQWTSCLIYLDDVIIFGRTLSEHNERLDSVLSRLGEAGLKLKPSKCHFLQKEVAFLGHVVSKEGVLPNPDNVAKLVGWPRPKTVTNVRALLGLGSYYRRFIPNFSKLANPLTQLTKKNESFVWTEACEEAYNLLRKALIGPEIMGYPKSDCHFILDTDACDVSIGAVLSQVQDGRERVIAYASCTLNRAERNYCVTDRELLAVKHYVQYYKHYLLGRTFTVRTDHQALKWLFSLREPKSRVARWIEILSAFNFDVEYRQGTKHGNADGMSRWPNPRDCTCPLTDPPDQLKCGPCTKCTRKSEIMDSSFTEKQAIPIRVVNSEQSRRHGSCKAEGHVVTQNTDFMTKSMSLFITIWVLITGILLLPLVSSDESVGLTTTGKQTIAFGQHSCTDQLTHTTLDDGRLRPKISNTCINLLDKLVNFVPVAVQRLRQRCRKVQTRSSTKTHDRTTVNDNALPTPGPKAKKPKKIPPGWASQYSMANLRQKQVNDPDIGPILRWFETGKRPYGTEVCANSPATRHYWNCWDLLDLRDGVLFRKFCKQNNTACNLQFLVPRIMREEILHQMHDSPLSGHLGKKKTREKTLQRFYWYGVRDNVNSWITRCDNCGANKTPTKTPKAPLGDMRVGAPLDRLATDILGPFPVTPRGNRYVLIVTDYFTNWVEILAVPDQTAITCADRILTEVISRFGCPLDLHSDQGANYRSNIFKELCRLLEIRKTQTTPRNPKCNGKVERFNKTLVRMIRAYLRGQQREWDRYLGCLAAAYRATPHEATGLTPNLMMFGREARLPAEVMFGSTTHEGEVASYGEYVDKLKARMQHAHDVARENLANHSKRQRDHYDGKVSLNRYSPGDLVWYLAEKRKVGECPKLYFPYEGPYLVVQKLCDLDYVIQRESRGPRKTVSHNKLKPYEGQTTFKWAKKAIHQTGRNAPSAESDESDTSDESASSDKSDE